MAVVFGREGDHISGVTTAMLQDSPVYTHMWREKGTLCVCSGRGTLLLLDCQDAVALRKIISARKSELEQVSKSGGSQSAARAQRVRTRCSAAAGPVSGPSLVAEIATLPDDPADDDKTGMECAGEAANTELANVYVRAHTAAVCRHVSFMQH